jgi:hypothetical protein
MYTIIKLTSGLDFARSELASLEHGCALGKSKMHI